MTDQTGSSADSATDTGMGPSMAVNAQYIKDLSFENPNVIRIMTQQGAGAPEVQMSLNVGVVAVGPESYEVTLSVRAEARRDDIVAFIVELAYAGVLTLSGVPQDQVEPFLLIEGPRMLFPFARAIVADVTRDGGFAPLMLTPVDFVDLYRRRVAERQAQGGVDAAPTSVLPN